MAPFTFTFKTIGLTINKSELLIVDCYHIILSVSVLACVAYCTVYINHNNHCIINHNRIIETSDMTSTLTLSLAKLHATGVSLLVYGCVQYHLSLVTSSSIDRSRMRCGLNENDLILSRLRTENNPITGRLYILLQLQITC